MQKKYLYQIRVNELRLKQKIASNFPHFYNPASMLFLLTIAFDTSNNQLLIVPNTKNSISKYITFIEKNNERILKKFRLNYPFAQVPKEKLHFLFFLVELNDESPKLSSVLQEISKAFQTKDSMPSTFPFESQQIIHQAQKIFKKLQSPHCIILNQTIDLPTTHHPLSIALSNDVIQLKLSMHELF
ncbi:hypothetical protein [Aureispira anguillae]|uniref:Uncharacterized protein n=1 Tax=Aureispira anguillae TaxID=2864201 RepID=A0A915YB37_9BACT|nr:hypothetical protein [Aureispira anguillae]BDS09810.1 hypothetical protein AsAng_0005150 [Aureispira anguillae]